MHGVALQSQGSQCVFNLQGDFLFVKFDSLVDWWRAEHQLQFPSTLHTYRMRQVRQIWQTRGGRDGDKSPVNNRKHKTRTAKTLGVEPFSVGKTKPNRRRRLPPTTAVRVTVQASLQCCTLFCVRCSESRTAHLSSIRKNRKILL